MFQKISIKEDGKLKDIADCSTETVKDWLFTKTSDFIAELIISLLKELRNEKAKAKNKKATT